VVSRRPSELREALWTSNVKREGESEVVPQWGQKVGVLAALTRVATPPALPVPCDTSAVCHWTMERAPSREKTHRAYIFDATELRMKLPLEVETDGYSAQ
jgi:hypothetical protein